ncbi:venom allergen 3 [Drosophila ficusphila]|uniref:venom allergen 3 n=1 Tax=Drosophila ficusphila TaxID=30025 RepID=UPI0007E6F28E|nr:venom allergen 3 [Drosophila ficusphila]
MLLFIIFLRVIGMQCTVIYRTRWPKYTQTKNYKAPIKPLDYCNGNLCPGNKMHITCSVRFWGPKCGGSHEGIMMNHYRDEILSTVNEMRKKVERGLGTLPRAVKLPAITWDEELSVIAMRVSNQCHDHSFGACVNTFRYDDVGESTDFALVNNSSEEITPIGFLQMWFDHYKDLHDYDVKKFPAASCGDHLRSFGNLIFEKNRKLGCGMLKSKNKRHFTCLFNRKIEDGDQLYKIVYDDTRRIAGKTVSGKGPTQLGMPQKKIRGNLHVGSSTGKSQKANRI